MTAERDSMTLNEVSVPALGAEERSDEAPRAVRQEARGTVHGRMAAWTRSDERDTRGMEPRRRATMGTQRRSRCMADLPGRSG